MLLREGEGLDRLARKVRFRQAPVLPAGALTGAKKKALYFFTRPDAFLTLPDA